MKHKTGHNKGIPAATRLKLSSLQLAILHILHQNPGIIGTEILRTLPKDTCSKANVFTTLKKLATFGLVRQLAPYSRFEDGRAVCKPYRITASGVRTLTRHIRDIGGKYD